MGRTRFISLGCLLSLFAAPVAAQGQMTDLAAPVFFATTPADAATPITPAASPSQAVTLFLRTATAPAADGRVPAIVVPLEDLTRRPAALVPMYAGMIALQTYDAYSTLAAIRRGAVETNPMAAAAVQQPAGFVAVKGVAAAGTIYAAERLWRKDRRKSAVVLMIVTNGMLAYASARNTSVLRAQRGTRGAK